MRRQHALSSRFQRGTQKVELWGGTQPVYDGTDRMDCFVAKLEGIVHDCVPRVTPEPEELAHLTRSQPRSEVASSSYSYQRLFSIVKRRSRRACDILILAGVIAPEISVLAP